MVSWHQPGGNWGRMFCLAGYSEKCLIGSGQGYRWPVWVKMADDVLMRPQIDGSWGEKQATSFCLSLGSEFTYVSSFFEVGYSQGESYFFVEGRLLCHRLLQPAPAVPHQPPEQGQRDFASRPSSTSAVWVGPWWGSDVGVGASSHMPGV